VNTQDKATIQLQAREELRRREVLRNRLGPEDNPEIYEIIKSTSRENPAPADVERLTKYLADNKEAVEKLGNLANHVETQVIENAFNSVLTKQSAYMHMAAMRVDMRYDQSSAIEKGLIDHIVLCWLRLHICEFDYDRYTKNASLERALFWEKALTAAQKRYLRSVETLARVRKLMQPAPSPIALALVKQQFNAIRG